MQTKKQPYELLVRWDQAGKLAGAHIQYRYVITDGHTVIGESVGAAEPITEDSEFKLTDAMAQVQADALARCAHLESANEAMRVQLAHALAKKDAER